jgi:hypothetical protein
LAAVCLIGLIFVSYLPVVILGSIKFIFINMVFSFFLLLGIVLIYYFMGSQLGPSVLIGCIIMYLDVIYTLLLLFCIICKCGLLPSSFAYLSFVDDVNLLSLIYFILINKYIYLIILFLLISSVYTSIASLLIIFSMITIVQGISGNLKGFSFRKFVATTSMITFSILFAYLI